MALLGLKSAGVNRYGRRSSLDGLGRGGEESLVAVHRSIANAKRVPGGGTKLVAEDTIAERETRCVTHVEEVDNSEEKLGGQGENAGLMVIFSIAVPVTENAEK